MEVNLKVIKMRKITIIFLFLLSCNNSNNELRKLNMKLEKENDSLREILNEINTKYVFDSIAFRDI